MAKAYEAATLCFANVFVVVTEEADAFVIDTGAMRAVLPKDRFALLSEVSVDLDGDGAYADDERVVREASEMFIDLDDAMPGPRDEGAFEHPRDAGPGVEGGSWMRASAAATATRHLASAGDYEVSVFRAGRAHTVFRLSIERSHADGAVTASELNIVDLAGSERQSAHARVQPKDAERAMRSQVARGFSP